MTPAYAKPGDPPYGGVADTNPLHALLSSGVLPNLMPEAAVPPAYAPAAYDYPVAVSQAGYQASVNPLRGSLPPGGLPDYRSQVVAGNSEATYNQPDYGQSPAYADPNGGYGPVSGESGRPMNPTFYRQVVAYSGHERPGTIIIDTPEKFLYLVQANGQAIRYGIGVGRPGFSWSGVKRVSRKAEWPAWTPPSQMLKRRPDLPRHMVGGEANPLGARALYLGSSMYRIHGTNEPYTIGTKVS